MKQAIITPAIDKHTAAQTIRHLMELWDVSWKELKELDEPATTTAKKSIPDAWERARGLLKGRGIDPMKFQNDIRSEWDHRP